MVRIIIATCAGVGVLSAISAQAPFCTRLWLFQPDSLFPSYRDSSQGSGGLLHQQGAVLGLRQTGQRLTSILIPPLMGGIADRYGVREPFIV